MEEVAQPQREDSLAPYVWMVCGCLSFAWMMWFANQLRDQCDWRVVALSRAGLVFLFAAGLARASGVRLVFADPPVLWLRSLAGSISLVCTFFALANLRTSEVLTLTNTFPIWVALLSWPLLRQRPTLAVWAGALCGVAGVYLIQAQHPGTGEWGGAQLAIPLALLAAFSTSVAMLGLNQLKGLHPWAIVTHFSGVATVVVLIAWLVRGVPDLGPLANPTIVALLLGVAVAATMGQFCLTQAFTLGQPARVAVVGLVQIVFVLGLDSLLSHEPFGLQTLTGIGLVMLPTAWVMITRASE